MKRFCKEKIEISNFLNSISIQAFRRRVEKLESNFQTHEDGPQDNGEAYEEAQNFINWEKELKPIKKECLTTPMITRGKKKKGLSLEKPR